MILQFISIKFAATGISTRRLHATGCIPADRLLARRRARRAVWDWEVVCGCW